MKAVKTLAAATALLGTLGTAAPAAAQWYPGYGYNSHRGYGYGYDRYRHRRRNDTGAAIAGIAAVGILAAVVASAAAKKKRDGGYGVTSERGAADACGREAEYRYGQAARAQIDDVYRTRDGYEVRGVVEPGYNGNYRESVPFTCDVSYGRARVTFDR